MRKIFAVAAFVFIAVAAGAPSVHASGSVCHLSPGQGDIVINFGGSLRIYSDRDPNAVERAVSIPRGNYEIMLQSNDQYGSRVNTNQPNEQYFVKFFNGGSLVGTSNSSDDLEDYVANATWSGVVNNNLALNQNINKIAITHTIPKQGGISANSLNPVCMMLRPVAVCGNGHVDQGEQCDDGNSASGDGCSNQCVVEEAGINIIKRDASDRDDVQNIKKGEDAVFEIVVRNTGQVTLNDVVVTDEKTPACNKNIGTLRGGETETYTCTATNVDDSFTNVARVVSEPANGGSHVTDEDPTEIIVAPKDPVCGDGELDQGEQCDDGNSASGDGCSNQCVVEEAGINIIKRDASDRDDVQNIKKGEDAVFEIVVRNTGQVTLNDVVVTDEKTPACNKNIGTLRGGETETYTCTATNVDDSFTNVARVVSEPANGGSHVTDEDPTEIIVTIPGAPSVMIEIRDAIDKDDQQTVEDGGTATFEVVVKNNGEVDLTDVRITVDNAKNCKKTIASLVVGEEVVYTCTAENITDAFDVVASVTATPVDGQDDVIDDDPTSVDVKSEPQAPICGNGKIETGEQCDDGNTINGDGCSNQCSVERRIVDPVCGNGIKEGNEQCDDGNRNDGDSCSNQCRIVTPEEDDDNDDDDDKCDGEIGNRVWNDLNRNGVRDAGEPGLDNVKLKLQYGDNVDKTRTSSSGKYDFDDLCEDTYRVIVAVETLDKGCYQTYDRDGKLDHMNKVRLDEGEEEDRADFGYYCPAHQSTHRPVSPKTGAGPLAGGAAVMIASGAAWMYQRRQMKGGQERSVIRFDH